MADFRHWPGSCSFPDMLKKALRLFVIKTRLEAWAIIYALAVGAVSRGEIYLAQYPGFGGWLLFAACTGAVFMAGAKILDATRGPKYRSSTLRRLVARARSL
jgi:hypothetical protein